MKSSENPMPLQVDIGLLSRENGAIDSLEYHNALLLAELELTRFHERVTIAHDFLLKTQKAGLAFTKCLVDLSSALQNGFLPSQNVFTGLSEGNLQEETCHSLSICGSVFATLAQALSMFCMQMQSVESGFRTIDSDIVQVLKLRKDYEGSYDVYQNFQAKFLSTAGPPKAESEKKYQEHRGTFVFNMDVYLTSLKSTLSTWINYSCLKVVHEIDNMICEFQKNVNYCMNALATGLSKFKQRQESLSKRDIESSTVIDSSGRGGGSTSKCASGVISVEGESVSGYLYKRGGSRVHRNWSKRWFLLTGSSLQYTKRIPFLNASLQSACSEIARIQVGLIPSSQSEFGYLVNRQDLNSLTSWNKLLAKTASFTPKWTVLESDLRICTAKGLNSPIGSGALNQKSHTATESYTNTEASERRFCLELITPIKGHRHILQCTCQEDVEMWVNFLSSQLNQSPTYTLTALNVSLLTRFPVEAKNDLCADCASDKVEWASVNLGVTLCTECASQHRSLGVHISKVRSLMLDNWEPESLHVMYSLGNRLVNLAICSGKKPSSAKWLRSENADYGDQETIEEAESYLKRIRGIYLKWLIQCQLTKQALHTGLQVENFDPSYLYRFARIPAVQEELFKTLTFGLLHKNRGQRVLNLGAYLGCPLLMMIGLFDGGRPEGRLSAEDAGEEEFNLSPALISAVRSGSMAACKFLLMHGANIDAQDSLGRTALHLACQLSDVNLVCLLLRNDADITIRDDSNRLASNIAVQEANGDIVTLFRMKQLTNDLKEVTFTETDETAQNVFRDFTQRGLEWDPPTVDLFEEAYNQAFSDSSSEATSRM